jgi:hypothetical protein
MSFARARKQAYEQAVYDSANTRLLAGKHAVDPDGHILQLRGIPAAHFGRHILLKANFRQRAAHFRPVDIALAEVSPEKPARRAIELKVLQMDLDNARPRARIQSCG